MTWIGLTVIVLYGNATNLYAQSGSLKFDRITTENTLTVKGLSQNSIFCMLQDSKGFIWIGTWDGLNKYDGYNFVIYNTSNGLSNPTVNSIVEDEDKNIWVGTADGLNKLNLITSKITQYHHLEDNTNTIGNDQINFLLQVQNDYLWIGTAFGLYKFDRAQKTFTSYNFFEKGADSSYTNFITCIRKDKSEKLWISTHHGIHCFDTENQSFEEYHMEDDPGSHNFIRSNYVQDLRIGENGDVYTATLNGLYIIKPGHGVIYHLDDNDTNGQALSGNQVNALLLDTRGLIWIGTNRGLDVLDPALNLVTNYKAGGGIHNLSNDDVRSIFEDHDGTIWIGTYKGLNKVDRSPSRFTCYRNDPEDPNSLSNNIVYALLKGQDNRIWIGTFGGVNILDLKSGKYSFLEHDPHNPHGLSGNRIRTLAIDSAGYYWVGTESNGINRIDPVSEKVTRFYHNDNEQGSISENNILSTMVDSRGRIWIGTVTGGLNVLDMSTGIIEHLSSQPESKVTLIDDKIWDVFEDRKGNFWLGTGGGLQELSADLEPVAVYQHDPTNPNSLSSDQVLTVTEGSRGYIWIGTMGGGLEKLDTQIQKFTWYSEHDGLPNNVVYAILEDEEGNLWISTNHGISKFNKLNETFVNYDTKDGVQGNEFNAGAWYKSRDGEMFFGGMNGFNAFYPDEITLNKVPPRMVFTGFRVMNAIVKRDIDDGEVIRLKYNENFFTIEFSGLDYTNPPKNLYRYKLENYDNDWVYVSAEERRADYRKVDPGTYTFIVTGSNNDGVWNPEGIQLTIIISSPWWETWVFRLVLALALIALIWSIIILRTRFVRRKHEVEKKMLSIEKQIFELEQKALRLQMNPHFIFNSLNAIQNFVLANDTDKAVNYLAKFSYLMRMILANSTASLITLKDELQALIYYLDLEKLRFDDKFDYIITHEPTVDEDFVEIPPMLFQPYVENAIIHGLVNSPKHGLLEIAIKKIGTGTLRCTIKDNGIGRKKAIEIRDKSGIKRQPRGMVITQERIEIFNQQNRKNFSVRITDLENEKGEPAGTMVEFTIQFKET